MKILHVIDSAGLYGAEVMLLNLMKEQRRKNIDSMLLSIESTAASNEFSMREEAIKRGLRAERMIMNTGYSLSNALKIIKFAKANSISMIHCHGYKGNILLGTLPRAVRKLPIISTIHGWTSTKIFSKIWVYTLLDKISLRRMDAVIYVNSGASRIGGKVRAHVIENGIDELDFNPGNALQNDPIVRDYCKDGFIVGTLSRLSGEKGLNYLIESARLLTGSIKNMKIIVIGDGPRRDFLRELVIKYGLADKVLIAGYRANAYHYLPLFDVFVLPSLTEGMPITILEAMQAEIPIVASAVGGIPSVLENGLYGILIKPGDTVSLADGIRRVWSQEEESKTMAGRAREKAITKYSCRRMSEEYLNVYQKVLSEWK